MTIEEALAILKEPDRIGFTVIKGNSPEDCEYNQKSQEALNMAVKPLARSTGHWEYVKRYDYYRCTCCGMERKADLSIEWNYCPRCGAYLNEREEMYDNRTSKENTL